jgi:hypothetical protein
MATPSRSSSSRSRVSARQAPAADSSQKFMLFAGIGVAVLIAVFVMMSDGGSKAAADDTRKPSQANPVSAPAAVPSAPPVTSTARAGKTPAEPPPVLSAATLGQARELEAKMKSYYNEGVNARTSGDNAMARDKQALAKQTYDEIEKLLQPALLWQEKADLNDWAQPAEFVELARFYNGVAALNKRVRMGGGK